MLPVESRDHPVSSGGKRFVEGIGLVDEILFGNVKNDLEEHVKKLPPGSGEQDLARRMLLFLEGGQGNGPLRNLSRINDAMLRLRPESSEYKDLQFEQSRAIEAINAGKLSLVDRVLFFFEEVF